jgi:hypothetical protein
LLKTDFAPNDNRLLVHEAEELWSHAIFKALTKTASVFDRQDIAPNPHTDRFMLSSQNGGALKFPGYKIQRAGLVSFSENIKQEMERSHRLTSIGRPVYMISNQGTKTRYRSKIVANANNTCDWENRLVTPFS